MFGFEGLLIAGLLAILLAGLGVLGVFLLFPATARWRAGRRREAAYLGIPALLILVLCVWAFLPRTLPQKSVSIDLTRPTDLSGIPAGTQWFTVPKKFCCVEGKVKVRIRLPSGIVIEDVTRQVYIDLDDKGFLRIDYTSLPIAPADVIRKNDTLLDSLFADSLRRESSRRDLNVVRSFTSAYRKGSEFLSHSVEFDLDTWFAYYGLNPTFIASEDIHYYFTFHRADGTEMKLRKRKEPNK